MLNMMDILRAEHQLIDDAYNEWILTLEPAQMQEGVWYLNGVHDMAERILKLLEGTEDE